MPTFWFLRFGQNAGSDARPLGPVVTVQQALADPSATGSVPLIEALDIVIRQELWREAISANGTPFESFGEFATAGFPQGLGVTSPSAATLVRCALFERCHYGPWTEVLGLIVRKSGRPKTPTNSSNSRFYTISRAATSSDRLLLELKNQAPKQFQRVCAGELTPYRAAVIAGFVAPPKSERKLHFGVCDIEGLKRLKPKVQYRLVRMIFRVAHLDAQCQFLANELATLDPQLGPRWRERWSHKGS